MKTIYILIGPKGSGKSFIGKLVEKEFNIPFLHVENWVKEVKKERDVTNELYRIEAFAVIENNVRDFLENNDNVIFESVGITHQFETMLESLHEDFKVVTIGVKANLDLCLERFKNRDVSDHVLLSDEEVIMINSAHAKNNMKTDFEIDNNKKSSVDLSKEFHKILIKQ